MAAPAVGAWLQFSMWVAFAQPSPRREQAFDIALHIHRLSSTPTHGLVSPPLLVPHTLLSLIQSLFSHHLSSLPTQTLHVLSHHLSPVPAHSFICSLALVQPPPLLVANPHTHSFSRDLAFVRPPLILLAKFVWHLSSPPNFSLPVPHVRSHSAVPLLNQHLSPLPTIAWHELSHHFSKLSTENVVPFLSRQFSWLPTQAWQFFSHHRSPFVRPPLIILAKKCLAFVQASPCFFPRSTQSLPLGCAFAQPTPLPVANHCVA
jgi:hypothetical protein